MIDIFHLILKLGILKISLNLPTICIGQNYSIIAAEQARIVVKIEAGKVEILKYDVYFATSPLYLYGVKKYFYVSKPRINTGLN